MSGDPSAADAHILEADPGGKQTPVEVADFDFSTVAVGHPFDPADREAWGAALAGVTMRQPERGIILGVAGSKIVNDCHAAVWFHHVHGRKAWALSHTPMSIARHDKRVTCAGDMSFLDVLLGSGEVACVLGQGDTLFVPSRMYHSTCHLDVTIMVIQWDGAEDYRHCSER